MDKKTHENGEGQSAQDAGLGKSAGTGADTGAERPDEIEATGDAIIVAEALDRIAAAITYLGDGVHRLADPEADEEQNPRRYLDGSIIPR